MPPVTAHSSSSTPRRSTFTFFGLLLVLIYVVVVIYIVTFVGFLLWQNSGDDTAPWSPDDHTSSHHANRPTGTGSAAETRARVSRLGGRLRRNNTGGGGGGGGGSPLSSLTPCDQTPSSSTNSTYYDVEGLLRQHPDDRGDNVESPTFPHCETSHGSMTTNAFQAVAGKHYVYSAYYDDRMVTRSSRGDHAGRAVVRIIALLHNQNSLLSTRPSPTIFCHTWWPDGVHRSSPVGYYEMCENHGKQYGGWILTCTLPSASADAEAEPPCVVGVSSVATASNEMVTIEVYRTAPSTSSSKFAVCVPPLFGHMSSKTLVEFVELSRLISADHLIFYVSTQRNATTRALSNALRHYQRTGLVSVVNWTLPGKLLPPGSHFVHAGKVWYHGQLTAINDCLYRTMHAFGRVAFNDIDEFIVPRDTSRRLSALLNEIDSRHILSTRAVDVPHVPYCAYSFRSAFFDPMSVSSGATALTSEVVEYELESDVRSTLLSGVRSKVVVDPLRVFELGIHHVSRPLVDGQCPVHHVDSSDAIIHHYRQCVVDFDVRIDCSRQCVDDTLTRSGLVPVLRRRVHQVLQLTKDK